MFYLDQGYQALSFMSFHPTSLQIAFENFQNKIHFGAQLPIWFLSPRLCSGSTFIAPAKKTIVKVKTKV